MTLENILHYLDTTARVSCPSITCEQAEEIATLLRSEESPLVNRTLKKWLEEANRDRGELTKQVYKLQSEVEVLEGDLSGCEFQLHEAENLQQAACGFAWDCGRELERQFSKYRDCGQDKVCEFSPGCNRHWEERNRELARELEREKDLNSMLRNGVSDLERAAEYRRRVDAGLPIVGDTATWEEATGDIDPAQTVRARGYWKNYQIPIPKFACGRCRSCFDENWNTCSHPLSEESTGDLDPGIYEGTGKGFEK